MSTYEQCPRCLEEGKTKLKMGVFEDGGKHCFRCGYHVRGDNREDYKVLNGTGDCAVYSEECGVYLTGMSDKFTNEALAYLYQFSITDQEMVRYGVKYIERGRYANGVRKFDIRNHLFFPIGDSGDFQTKALSDRGRCVTPKNYSSGYDGVYFIKAERYPDLLVVAESILDAICIARTGCSVIALLGSSIGLSKINSILNNLTHDSGFLPGTVYLWLDNDRGGEKNRDKIASFFESICGSKVNHIRTKKDPKFHSPNDINSLIGVQTYVK